MSLTPEQFNKIVLKEDLKEFEERMSEKNRRDKDEIIEILEDIATNIKDIKIEQAANIGAHDRFQNKLDLHEIRIKKLETEKV